MLFQCWSSAVGGGPIVKQHWVKSSRLLGSTQVSVYTHPSPTIIFSPADQGTFSKTAGQSQAYYITWNLERGTYDINHLHILTCEGAVSRVSSVPLTPLSPLSLIYLLNDLKTEILYLQLRFSSQGALVESRSKSTGYPLPWCDVINQCWGSRRTIILTKQSWMKTLFRKPFLHRRILEMSHTVRVWNNTEKCIKNQ